MCVTCLAITTVSTHAYGACGAPGKLLFLIGGGADMKVSDEYMQQTAIGLGWTDII